VSPDWYKYQKRYENHMQSRAGKPVQFCKTKDGHLRVTCVGDTTILAHHIVWVLVYGEMPKDYIDHIDGNPENNAISNLRDVTHRVNHRNQKKRSNNSSGFGNVCWHKATNKWQARVRIQDTVKHLGVFAAIEDAVAARDHFINENPQLGYTERHSQGD